MPAEIRPAREEDQERVNFVIAYSFDGDRTPEGRQRMRHVEELTRTLALLEDGEIAAALRMYDFSMLVNGAGIGLGGVSSVACLPEHRRKGYVGQLLRHALSDMRERGLPLSALYTPHPSLYRRYGWMFAAANLHYTWNPKDVRHLNSAPLRGRARRVGEEEWPALAQVYERFTRGRTGYLERSDRWWREAIFRRLYDPERKPLDVALWQADGEPPSGYVCYRSSSELRPSGPGKATLSVREFIALEADAHAGLLRYILAHDLAHEVAWWGPVDDPLALAIDEPGRLKREYREGYMLRVVDVQKAVEARPPATGAPEGSFSVHIADASAPWNQGAWRIESSGGRLSCSRAEGPAEIATNAAGFAAIYGGFLRCSDAVRCGLAQAEDAKAVALADRILASDYTPFGADFF
jgi:predicted acetyltransferase